MLFYIQQSKPRPVQKSTWKIKIKNPIRFIYYNNSKLGIDEEKKKKKTTEIDFQT